MSSLSSWRPLPTRNHRTESESRCRSTGGVVDAVAALPGRRVRACVLREVSTVPVELTASLRGPPAVPVDTYRERDDALDHSGDDPERAATPRRVVARQRARDLLDAYEVATPPVPVRDIAKGEGFQIKDHPDLRQLSARMRPGWIELLASEPEVRKRFSIAHELGHHHMQTLTAWERQLRSKPTASPASCWFRDRYSPPR